VPLGGGVYAETPTSGARVFCTPGQAGAGTLMDGFLESSNVDPIKEAVKPDRSRAVFAIERPSDADRHSSQTGDCRSGRAVEDSDAVRMPF